MNEHFLAGRVGESLESVSVGTTFGYHPIQFPVCQSYFERYEFLGTCAQNCLGEELRFELFRGVCQFGGPSCGVCLVVEDKVCAIDGGLYGLKFFGGVDESLWHPVHIPGAVDDDEDFEVRLEAEVRFFCSR